MEQRAKRLAPLVLIAILGIGIGAVFSQSVTWIFNDNLDHYSPPDADEYGGTITLVSPTDYLEITVNWDGSGITGHSQVIEFSTKNLFTTDLLSCTLTLNVYDGTDWHPTVLVLSSPLAPDGVWVETATYNSAIAGSHDFIVSLTDASWVAP